MTILTFIENIFMDAEKTEEVHRLKNAVTVTKLEIEHKNRIMTRELLNTTAYKVAKAAGKI